MQAVPESDTLYRMNAYLLENAVSARVEGVADFRVAKRSADRLLGAFYTDTNATEAMARWTLRTSGDRVLEPSFGDGAFLHALRAEAKARDLSRVQLFGAELVHEPFTAAVRSKLLASANAFLGDFLAVKPFEVDAVIGNPPYVRLRHLPSDQLDRALKCADSVLGQPMDTSGSVWMPFVLHCLQFLRFGGRLAMVLPHELTYVRYARPLWKKLGESFADLRVVRVHERLFPDILQEVVVLFADKYGKSTSTVRYQSLERAEQFAESDDLPFTDLSINEIVAGSRAFLEALLPTATRNLLSRVLARSASPVAERCSFNIGYVSGDKDFFHPSAEAIQRYSLPESSLKASLTSGRQIRRCGLFTSNPNCVAGRLYLPPVNERDLTASERRYIAAGEDRQIHKRYKCSVRSPWYAVPGVRVPDLLLSVFANCPVLAINDGNYVASNSLLCGRLHKGTAEGFCAAWYNSLTLLQIELQVHSLGGGVMVLVPGEVAKIQLPSCRPTKSLVERIDGELRTGNLETAYQCGDVNVLREQLRLSAADVENLREGIDILRRWRNSASTRASASEREELE
jgi:adenine-specific DNA-methyltransferase